MSQEPRGRCRGAGACQPQPPHPRQCWCFVLGGNTLEKQQVPEAMGVSTQITPLHQLGPDWGTKSPVTAVV